jgi:hypothetical protein
MKGVLPWLVRSGIIDFFRLILNTYEADVVKGVCGLGEAAQHSAQVGQLILVEGQVTQASRQLPALQVRVAVSIMIQLR